MRFPDDAPLWLVRAFREVETDVEELVAKSPTNDAAMKASGAYWLLHKIKATIYEEIARQETAEKQRIESLHARRNADA